MTRSSSRPAWCLALSLAFLVAACGSTDDGSTGQGVSEIEQALFDLVNQHRQSEGLDDLVWDSVVAELCREHSQYQYNMDDMNHTGFEEERWPALVDRIGAQSAAENVAYNQGWSDPAERAFQSWYDSPGHKTNMEGNYNRSAMGVVGNESDGYYYTQIFARVP